MTRDEKINTLKAIIQECEEYQWQRKETLFEIIKDLEHEPILDKYQAEIDHLHKYIGKLETQITEDSFINKPCVSEKVCEHDKQMVLDKIRAEIKQYQSDYDVHGTEYDRTAWKAFNRCLQIIDKYKADKEG